MTKKPFQEQLSKFSLLRELPKVETGLEEAWENLKKCTEPFTAQDIIRQQQETINRQKAEIERYKYEHTQIDDFARNICKERLLQGKAVADFDSLRKYVEREKAEAVKKFAERSKLKVDIDLCEAVECSDYLYNLPKLIDNLVKEMVGEDNV